MARTAQASASPQPRSTPPARAPRRNLEVVQQPRKRGAALLCVLAVAAPFLTAMAVVALHTVNVQNQAGLDDLRSLNTQRVERIEAMQAQAAHLDSPEGLDEQARSAGLVPAAELVTLTPVGDGLLLPPEGDVFGLNHLKDQQ